jgi:hypothetical protein
VGVAAGAIGEAPGIPGEPDELGGGHPPDLGPGSVRKAGDLEKHPGGVEEGVLVLAFHLDGLVVRGQPVPALLAQNRALFSQFRFGFPIGQRFARFVLLLVAV